MNPFEEEDGLQIANAVYVCIIGGFVILLKENWDKWTFIKDTEGLKRAKKAKDKGDDGNKAGSTPAGGNENPAGLEPVEGEATD